MDFILSIWGDKYGNRKHLSALHHTKVTHLTFKHLNKLLHLSTYRCRIHLVKNPAVVCPMSTECPHVQHVICYIGDYSGIIVIDDTWVSKTWFVQQEVKVAVSISIFTWNTMLLVPFPGVLVLWHKRVFPGTSI